MGIFTNFLDQSVTIDKTPEINSLSRRVVSEIQREIDRGDPERPPLVYDPRNERQTLLPNGATGGTFTGTMGVRFNNTNHQVPVGDIPYNVNESGLQTILDNALSGVVPGYVNGDLDVFISGAGNTSINSAQLRYSGDSLKETRHPVGSIDSSGLIGGVEILIERIDGQTARDVWAVMKIMSLVGFGVIPPEQGTPNPSLTHIIDRDTTRFSEPTLRAIAKEAAIQDFIPDEEQLLLEAFGL